MASQKEIHKFWHELHVEDKYKNYSIKEFYTLLNKKGISEEELSKYNDKMDAKYHKYKWVKHPRVGGKINIDYDLNLKIFNTVNHIKGVTVYQSCSGHIDRNAMLQFSISNKKVKYIPSTDKYSIKYKDGKFTLERKIKGIAPLSWWNVVISLLIKYGQI